MIERIEAELSDIISNSVLRKPRRHVIVADTVTPKEIINTIRAELNKLEKPFTVFNVSHGAYLFVLKNMSTIEIVSKNIYDNKHHSHIVTNDGSEPEGYRVHPFNQLVS